MYVEDINSDVLFKKFITLYATELIINDIKFSSEKLLNILKELMPIKSLYDMLNCVDAKNNIKFNVNFKPSNHSYMDSIKLCLDVEYTTPLNVTKRLELICNYDGECAYINANNQHSNTHSDVTPKAYETYLIHVNSFFLSAFNDLKLTPRKDFL